ncbi:MAG: CheR family methyltransferase, partial [Persicimonas sp.]
MRRRESATNSAVSRASALLSEWTGLELRGATPRRVDEFLKTRAQQLGYDSKSAYVDHLQSLEPDDPESQRLINLVTNGLTAFWRDKPQLDALATVLDKLREGRSNDQPVNVWCAGCSSGEEAYTVAMIADRHDVPTYVLGSDLNTEALASARRG